MYVNSTIILSFIYGFFIIGNIGVLMNYNSYKEYNDMPVLSRYHIFLTSIEYIVFSLVCITIVLLTKNNITPYNYRTLTFTNKLIVLYNILVLIFIETDYIFIETIFILSVCLIFIGIIHDIIFLYNVKNDIISKGYTRRTCKYDTNEECCICIEYYKTSEDVHILECNHKFHLSCIKKLIISHDKCPLCRNSIV